MKTLQKCLRSDCVPDDVKAGLPKDLLGFLLVDTDACRCVSFIASSSGDLEANAGVGRRKQRKEMAKIDRPWIYGKLRDFYKYVSAPVVLLETRSLRLVLWNVNLAMVARDYATNSRVLRGLEFFARTRRHLTRPALFSSQTCTCHCVC